MFGNMTPFKTIVAILCLTMLLCCCKKNSLITNADAILNLSADTLKFDTVFTSAGSVIKSFKIYNDNDQKIKLSSVKLMGGTASAFKINVDGTSAVEVSNIEIQSNDSLYVFVQVNINPGTNNLPFVITDSILINYNGNNKFVQLQAYGQNAVFLDSRRVSGNYQFTKGLPYVILGGLLIDSSATLTIDKGSKIYVHANAPIIVDGTLAVNGTFQEQVTFSGDRLDPDYKDLPAGWPGIYFRESSRNSTLQFAVIKNAYQALIAQGSPSAANPKIKISQCIIDNSYDAGVLAINSSVSADNTLISNCGSNILLAHGGNYNFTNCTVASYGSIFLEHKNPVLQVYNYIVQDNNQTISGDLNASFTNCIFWGEGGNVDNEVIVNKQGTNVFNVTFDHVLYKALKDPENVNFIVPAIKQDPLFDSINISKLQFDFHLNNNSPAINAGTITPFVKDLDDKPRPNALPDLGCYEK